MKYLYAEEILILHAKIIEATGGSKGIRDINLFASLVERPKTSVFGEEQFKTVFEKAGVYLESIARYHVFVDGNKRTAFASSVRFLFINGYRFKATNKEVEKFVLKVAVGKEDVKTAAEWLKKHSKKSR